MPTMIVMDDDWLVLRHYDKTPLTTEWHFTFDCGHWDDMEIHDARQIAHIFTHCACGQEITNVRWNKRTWNYKITLDCGHVVEEDRAPRYKEHLPCTECGIRWNVASIERFIADWADTQTGELCMAAEPAANRRVAGLRHPHALEGPLTGA